jgi:ubiquinone/menaquinone biosynthesis C-methylase UbiE
MDTRRRIDAGMRRNTQLSIFTTGGCGVNDESTGVACGNSDVLTRLSPYLAPNASVTITDGVPTHPIPNPSPGLRANAHYFGHPKWAKTWADVVHRYPEFRQRWLAAAGSWDGKVVVDIGCGPGNLHASLRCSPRLLIGVDVSANALVMAERLGYTPLRADAHALPLIDQFADYVALNATLHHCDDMTRVLAEAARLVRTGGILVVDHDPQRTAWDFRGPGLWLWKARLPLYRWLKRGGHAAEDDEQTWALATELHHNPGDGLTREMLVQTLQPLGFDIKIYPHNHRIGAEVTAGKFGRAPLKIRVAQRLSGITPNSEQGCLSLLCVATRK